MKITENLTDLVVELGELETFERAGMVICDDGVSVKELLDLFSETNNSRSREVVREIFDEVGYGWFVDLDESAMLSATDLKNVAGKREAKEQVTSDASNLIVSEVAEGDGILSEAEFLELTPPNSYIQ